MALLEAKTALGTVRGVRANNPGYTIFKGIPYAKPPVGELRYAPPQPAEPWEGVRNCDRWGNACVQAPGSFGFYQKEFYPEPKVMSEDCLYLNIWTPAESADEKRPVFFWIHGGGYTGGYGHEMEFDGEAMCKRGCILVTINYRLGSFGFFAHPELTRRFGKSGNAGMYDQIAALRWVHENIAAFGGDPNNITVHGQSAGGMSARTLLASPLCRGLMNRVIIQSGGGLNEWSDFRTMADQERFGEQLLEAAGLSIDALMALPAAEAFERLNEAGVKVTGNPMLMGFAPCIDFEALTQTPSACIKAGTINTTSVMCGSVGGDAMLQGMSAGLDVSAGSALCYGASVALARHQDAAGAPIYVYEFDRNPPGDELGPFHSVELWYMFGSLYRAWRPWTGYDYELSDAMVDYWCAFARTGDPNVPDRPAWPAYTAETPVIMHFTDMGYLAENLVRTEADEAIVQKMMG